MEEVERWEVIGVGIWDFFVEVNCRFKDVVVVRMGNFDGFGVLVVGQRKGSLEGRAGGMEERSSGAFFETINVSDR